MAMLQVSHLQKIYTARLGTLRVQALRDVDFSVEAGEFVSVMGESGSGKTTLLNILAALDKPTEGAVLLDGQPLSRIPDRKLSAFRRDRLGFVFQDFNLLDNFTLRDNIFLPLVLARIPHEEMNARLAPLAQMLEITDVLDKYPYEVSGGQKQRAAAARAVITQPSLLLADEPTGALDSRASEKLLDMFCRLNAQGQTIVMVTHSAIAASRSARILFIKDGVVFHELRRGAQKRDGQLLERISDALTMLATGRLVG